MLKFILSISMFLTVVCAEAKTKFDISGLAGEWQKVNCSNDITFSIYQQTDGTTSYSFNRLGTDNGDEYVGKIDKGSSDFNFNDCSWGLCGYSSKTNGKAKTVAANKLTVQFKDLYKGFFDLFWQTTTKWKVVYELVDAQTLRKSEKYDKAKEWSSCTFTRKL